MSFTFWTSQCRSCNGTCKCRRSSTSLHSKEWRRKPRYWLKSRSRNRASLADFMRSLTLSLCSKKHNVKHEICRYEHSFYFLSFLGTSSWIDFTNPEIRKWWSGKFALNEYQVPEVLNVLFFLVFGGLTRKSFILWWFCEGNILKKAE